MYVCVFVYMHTLSYILFIFVKMYFYIRLLYYSYSFDTILNKIIGGEMKILNHFAILAILLDQG